MDFFIESIDILEERVTIFDISTQIGGQHGKTAGVVQLFLRDAVLFSCP